MVMEIVGCQSWQFSRAATGGWPVRSACNRRSNPQGIDAESPSYDSGGFRPCESSWRMRRPTLESDSSPTESRTKRYLSWRLAPPISFPSSFCGDQSSFPLWDHRSAGLGGNPPHRLRRTPQACQGGTRAGEARSDAAGHGFGARSFLAIGGHRKSTTVGKLAALLCGSRGGHASDLDRKGKAEAEPQARR